MESRSLSQEHMSSTSSEDRPLVPDARPINQLVLGADRMLKAVLDLNLHPYTDSARSQTNAVGTEGRT